VAKTISETIRKRRNEAKGFDRSEEIYIQQRFHEGRESALSEIMGRIGRGAKLG